jgi:hypothetical protein
MSTRIAQVFTSRFRARSRLTGAVGLALASTAPFAAGLLVLTYAVGDPRGRAAAAVTAVALLAAAVSAWLAGNLLALAGNRQLREGLRGRWAECQATAGAGTPVFAGFAPGENVLVWEGDTDLDVGYLCAGPDDLVFLGDQFDWSLHKERVDGVELTPPTAGPQRIIIRWHAPREAARSLTLESREARTLWGADRQTLRLFHGLEDWLATAPVLTQRGYVLGQPPTNIYGGRRADEAVAGWCATTMAMLVIVALTIWTVTADLLRDSLYYHAVLWAGFVFVAGAMVMRAIHLYLQSTSPPSKVHGAASRP